jgi:hypothetical protein
LRVRFLESIQGQEEPFDYLAAVTHDPIIEAAMPDIFAFFAKQTMAGRK